MAKKVVATLKTADGRGFAKIIKMVKSPKTGAYTFKEQMVPNDQVKEAVRHRKPNIKRQNPPHLATNTNTKN